MKNPADAKPVIGLFRKLSRAQRSFVAAIALVLLPACLGLAYLITDFWTTSKTKNRVFVSATARDTLILSGYDHTVRAFNVAQEAYADPAKRDSLRPIFDARVRTLHGIATEYVNLLTDLPAPDRDRLEGAFSLLWQIFDELVGRSTKAFTSVPPKRASVGGAAPSGVRQPQQSFLQDPNLFFSKMRESLDRSLRSELEEDLLLVQRARAEAEVTTYRGFFIAFFLFGLGATLAVIVVARGRKNEEGRRRYETLLDASLNPIEVVNLHGKILYVNPASERWRGMASADLLGHSIFDAVQVPRHSQEKAELWLRIAEVLKSGHAWSGEVELPRSRGEVSYMLLILSPVLSADGRLIEAIGIYHDVTERRELARKFEESQEKYQNIVESSLDGIVIVQEGKLVFVNTSSAKIFGYESPEDMKDVSFEDTVAPSNRFLVLEGYEGRAIGEDVLRNFEMKGLSKQGRVIDLEVNAKLVSWNGKPAVQASFRDITKRKSLEREQALWLWEQETMSTIDRQLVSSVSLQSVLDAISYHAKALTRADWAGVIMVDLDTNLARWRAVTGNRVPMPDLPLHLEKVHAAIIRSKEPVVMKDLGVSADFPVEQFPPFAEEKIIAAVRFPLIVENEIRGQLVIGYRRPHDFAAREMRLLTSLAEKSSIALANAELYDNLLSREKELELLSGARVRAQEDERRRIAREIHDSLGQMLTAIKFNVEILEDAAGLQTEEDAKRLVDIKSLLDNAMAEAREISYNLMPSVLVDFGLVPALQFLGEQFSKSNQLTVKVHTNGVEGRLDPSIEVGLYRIAQEALNNIAKHAGATEINVQLIGDSKSMKLIIEDDGKGFHVSRFEPQTHQRRGMGLVSMRERAASFNGVFVLDSHPGHGTEIIVEVPRMDSENNG
ncbi:MAG: PAS domain S-box protein [Ignavibacteriales bacterium]|nr:PAS domain S-box protein [Ignavibacteriales bacterium]